ncbi:MAG: VCBS repeat-containing protein [Planctomycetes bacterium]|nr:VCBS repeat-containing protein [Planctomycetota bacterium]
MKPSTSLAPIFVVGVELVALGRATPQSDVGWCAERFANALANPFSGAMPDLLELADVNGDGRLDVFFNGVVGGVRLALAQPTGGHLPALTNSGLESPSRLCAGDIDGDGNLDVVTRAVAGGAARVYLGDGMGVFAFSGVYWMSSGSAPAAADLALGDVDGDGALDLVAVDQTTRELGVRSNIGGGAFGPLSVTSLPGYPGQLELGDVDGDGDLDAVGHGIGQTTRIGILFGDGLGNFSNALATAINAYPFVLRDIDLDGRLDIAVATANQGAGGLRVFLGQGGGAFSLASSNSIGAELEHLAVGDFDGDGKLDAAVGDVFGATWLLEGLGAGSFGTPRRLDVLDTRGGLRAADIDGDGYEDLALLGVSTMGVLYGSPIDPLALPQPFAIGGVASALASADFDGDGQRDVLAARSQGATELVEVLRGDGNGGLSAGTTSALASRAAALVAGDFDGDGQLDALGALPGTSSVAWLRGLPGGALAPAQTVASGAAFTHLSRADFDGDGFDDALASADGQMSIAWLRGGAPGPVLAGQLTLPANVVAMACGDLNGDGLDDALVATADQGLHWFAGAWNGPQAPLSYYTGRNWLALDVGALDSDAFADALLTTAEGALIARYGSSSGPGLENPLTPLAPYEAAHLEDVDGDGRSDCVFEIVLGQQRMFGVRRGSAAGFLEPSLYAMAVDHGPMALIDLDDDGRAEAVVAERQAPLLRLAHRRKGARFESYCAAGTSVNGCVARLTASGEPSASSNAGFVLTSRELDGQRSALSFLSVSYPLVQPWAVGSSSSLCVTPPIVRMSLQFSGGTPGACDGSISIDANSFIALTPWNAGQIAFAQTWVRDPLAPKGSQLSNGLAFELGP